MGWTEKLDWVRTHAYGRKHTNRSTENGTNWKPILHLAREEPKGTPEQEKI